MKNRAHSMYPGMVAVIAGLFLFFAAQASWALTQPDYPLGAGVTRSGSRSS